VSSVCLSCACLCRCRCLHPRVSVSVSLRFCLSRPRRQQQQTKILTHSGFCANCARLPFSLCLSTGADVTRSERPVAALNCSFCDHSPAPINRFTFPTSAFERTSSPSTLALHTPPQSTQQLLREAPLFHLPPAAPLHRSLRKARLPPAPASAARQPVDPYPPSPLTALLLSPSLCLPATPARRRQRTLDDSLTSLLDSSYRSAGSLQVLGSHFSCDRVLAFPLSAVEARSPAIPTVTKRFVTLA
jgi:hypothetical protein